jgi:hypothetical protein
LAGGGRVAIAASETTHWRARRRRKSFLGHRWLRRLLPHALSACAGCKPRRRATTSCRGRNSRRNITLTRNPMNSSSIAHHVVALAWACFGACQMRCGRNPQATGPPLAAMLPLPRTALVLGLGAIGMQVSGLLRGLGLHVRGTSNSGSAGQREACDELRRRKSLARCVARHRYPRAGAATG